MSYLKRFLRWITVDFFWDTVRVFILAAYIVWGFAYLLREWVQLDRARPRPSRDDENVKPCP